MVLLYLPLVVQVVASPADLVKVRMQADGHLVSQGLQPRYSGPLDALNKIVHTEGFGGLRILERSFPKFTKSIFGEYGRISML